MCVKNFAEQMSGNRVKTAKRKKIYLSKTPLDARKTSKFSYSYFYFMCVSIYIQSVHFRTNYWISC